MPVLNEAEGIGDCLARLAALRSRGAEVIVVDGGSADDTVERAASCSDRVVGAPRGRGAQMNAGAAVAHGEILVFLHADTRLPADADRLLAGALEHSRHDWGRFDVRIAGRHVLLPLVARAMNLRSRATGIATGDQAIFVRRTAFEAIGGYDDIPLMEDIALSKALKKLGPPACIAALATTSGRRWEKNGVMRTVFLMWRLRLAYFFGANPRTLALRYGYVPRQS